MQTAVIALLQQQHYHTVPKYTYTVPKKSKPHATLNLLICYNCMEKQYWQIRKCITGQPTVGSRELHYFQHCRSILSETSHSTVYMYVLEY